MASSLNKETSRKISKVSEVGAHSLNVLSKLQMMHQKKSHGIASVVVAAATDTAEDNLQKEKLLNKVAKRTESDLLAKTRAARRR